MCEGQSSTKLNAANNKVVKAGRRVIVSPANGAAARVAEEANKREAAILAAAPARRAANVTAAYICAVGFALMFFPAKTFGLVFDVEAITDAWIRVFGVLCVAFGAYYVGAAYGDRNGWGARGFYAATVVGRAFIFAAFLGFAAAGWHPEPAIVGLGFVNLLGALAMWHALAGKKKGRREGGGGRLEKKKRIFLFFFFYRVQTRIVPIVICVTEFHTDREMALFGGYKKKTR